MTINQWIKYWKQNENSNKNVARVTYTHEDSNTIIDSVDSTDDSRIKIQYKTSLNDPRRI